MALQDRASLPWAGVSRITPLTRKFRRGELLFDQDHPRGLTIIEEGWACRSRLTKDGRRQILGLSLPGEICGSHPEASIWVDFSTVALSAVRVTVRPIEIEQSAILLEHALAEVAISARWIARLGQRSAVQKVADLIEELAMRQGYGEDDHIASAPFLLTQYDLADATGLTAIHVNRTLREMREMDLLTVKRGEIEIPSMVRLRAVAAGGSGTV